MICRAVQVRPDRFKLVDRSFRNANQIELTGSPIALSRAQRIFRSSSK